MTTTTIVCWVGDDCTGSNHCLLSWWWLQQPLSVELVTTKPAVTTVCWAGDDYNNHCLLSWWRLNRQKPVCWAGDDYNNHCLLRWWRLQQPLSVELVTTAPAATIVSWVGDGCTGSNHCLLSWCWWVLLLVFSLGLATFPSSLFPIAISNRGPGMNTSAIISMRR